MKKFIYSIIAIVLAACSAEEGMVPVQQETGEGIYMSIPDFTWEGNTRTTLTSSPEGVSFAWKEGDQVGVYAVSSMASFNVKSVRQDARSAAFDGGGFGLTAGNTYYAFYPYNGWSTNKTAIMVAYTGQVQAANDDISHLSAYDFMTSQTTALATNMADFNFSHMGAILKVQVMLPKAGIYTQLKVVSSETPFVLSGMIDLTSDTPVVVPYQSSNELILTLGENGIQITDGNPVLTAYLITPPVDLSHDELTFTVSDTQNSSYSYTMAGKNMLAGYAYGYRQEDPSTMGSYNGHDYIDLGLPSGTLWATCNLGAEKPTDYGQYYAWGETKGYGEEDTSNLHNYTTQGSYVKTKFASDTYKFCTGSDFYLYSLNKYTIDDQEYEFFMDDETCSWYDADNNFIGDGLSKLTDEDDAARANWGEGWTIPTIEQMQELMDNCTFVLYVAGNLIYDGIAGYKVKSKINGNIIFLPIAGYRYGEGLSSVGSRGYYWSSELEYSSYTAHYFNLSSSGVSNTSTYLRQYGYSIRPVHVE